MIDHHYSIYIIGGGTIGSHLAERLKLHSVRHLVIDRSARVCDDLHHKGVETMVADGLDADLYKKLKLRGQDTVVLLTESDTLNAKIAAVLLNETGHEKIVTTTFNSSFFIENTEVRGIQYIGVQDVIAAQIENEILRPTTSHALTDSFGEYSLEEIQLTNKEINRKQVKDLPFPPSGSLIVLRRDREVFIPHGDSQLLVGDIITVIGDHRALQDFRRILE